MASEAQGRERSERDFETLLTVFLRRKFWIVGGGLIGLALGIAYVATAPKIYRTYAMLIVDSQRSNPTGLKSLDLGVETNDEDLNSQVEIIRSRNILGQVVDRLSLDENPDFMTPKEKAPLLMSGIRWIRDAVDPGAAATAGPARERAIDRLSNELDLDVVRRTHVFRMAIEATTPELAAEIVNTVGRVFEEDQKRAKLTAIDAADERLSEDVERLGAALVTAEALNSDFLIGTERIVTDEAVAAANEALRNARGRRETFVANLRRITGDDLPKTDRDRARLGALNAEIAVLGVLATRQSDDMLRLRQLTRDVEASRKIYDFFVSRENEIEVQRGLQEADVRILSEAVPKYRPVRPRTVLTALIYTIIGSLLGAFVVLVHSLFKQSFSSASELEDMFGLPVLGAVPQMSRKGGPRGVLTDALKNPSSPMMESVRGIRTALTSRGSAGEGQVVLVTSSTPGEGKTTCAILLALNAVTAGRRVLLVECDLRRSTFESTFGRRSEAGLADAIAGSPEATVWNEPNSGLDVIFGGGAKGPNPTSLFESDAFAARVAEMRAHYDLVILDTPPVLSVSDARIIARVVDQILYVVRHNATATETVESGVEALVSIGAPIAGFCLSQAPKIAGVRYRGALGHAARA